MEAINAGERLAQDIQANFAIFQTTSLIATLVIALIAAVLAARAGNMLSEARQLYWRTREAEKSMQKSMQETGGVSVMQSRAVQQMSMHRVKKPSSRNRTVV